MGFFSRLLGKRRPSQRDLQRTEQAIDRLLRDEERKRKDGKRVMDVDDTGTPPKEVVRAVDEIVNRIDQAPAELVNRLRRDLAGATEDVFDHFTF
jgi:hypothetical protein